MDVALRKRNAYSGHFLRPMGSIPLPGIWRDQAPNMAGAVRVVEAGGWTAATDFDSRGLPVRRIARQAARSLRSKVRSIGLQIGRAADFAPAAGHCACAAAPDAGRAALSRPLVLGERSSRILEEFRFRRRGPWSSGGFLARSHLPATCGRDFSVRLSGRREPVSVWSLSAAPCVSSLDRDSRGLGRTVALPCVNHTLARLPLLGKEKDNFWGPA